MIVIKFKYQAGGPSWGSFSWSYAWSLYSCGENHRVFCALCFDVRAYSRKWACLRSFECIIQCIMGETGSLRSFCLWKSAIRRCICYFLRIWRNAKEKRWRGRCGICIIWDIWVSSWRNQSCIQHRNDLQKKNLYFIVLYWEFWWQLRCFWSWRWTDDRSKFQGLLDFYWVLTLLGGYRETAPFGVPSHWPSRSYQTEWLCWTGPALRPLGCRFWGSWRNAMSLLGYRRFRLRVPRCLSLAWVCPGWALKCWNW